MGAAFENLTRTPGGHPEGYLEAFANLYAQTAEVIRAHKPGQALPIDPPLPGISDGLAGVQFVNACVTSSRKNAGWVTLAQKARNRILKRAYAGPFLFAPLRSGPSPCQ
jgi:hypothetical protein